MTTLKNIEFFMDSEGDIAMRFGDEYKVMSDELHEINIAIVEKVRATLPEAVGYFEEMYSQSKPNRKYHTFLVSWQLCACLFSNLDGIKDIDESGEIHVERVFCPALRVCPARDIVCRAKRRIELTDRQAEIVRLYAMDKNTKQIAEELGIKEITVNTTNKQAVKRTGMNNFIGLVARFSKKL